VRSRIELNGGGVPESLGVVNTFRTFLPVAAGVLLGAVGLGCSYLISHQETVRRDEQRLPISFETDAAARTFYGAVEKIRASSSPTESKSEFHIPVILSHEITTVTGPHQVFNESVRRADTNQDGKITEKEARIFADNAK
jgi:hypothetical protein